MASNNSKKYLDLLTAFPFGINSGVAPLLLPREQCSFALNTTFRGGYATDRPPQRKITLAFDTGEVRDAMRRGFFQGAGVYRPDFGASQVIAQISGRLFAFTENGSVWDVTEITIPGDPNDATTSQVWMWQSEKWLIISDGSAKLPIFYDGVTTRRSYGPSVLIATTTAGWTVPEIGESVAVTLTAPYTGPLNVPVITNDGAIYELAPVTGTENARLTNLYDTPGNPIPDNSEVVVRPGFVGRLTTSSNSSTVIIGCIQTATLSLSAVFTSPNLTNVLLTPSGFGQVEFTVIGGSGTNTITVRRFGDAFCSPYTFPAGSTVFLSTPPSPNVVLGNTVGAETAPVVGGSIDIVINPPYSGPDNQTVWIGSAQYEISALVIVPGVNVSLINLNDTGTDPAVGQDIFSVPEIPACRMGVYGMGQNWFSAVDGLSFGCSDIVGGSSGTPANNYRDAVLKTNDLTVMGYFRLPVAGEIITSMTFVATLDQALGQGPLQIGVASGMFSVRAPFTLIDFNGTSITEAVANPILTKSLIGFGPVAQNSTVLANSDTIFRSFEGVNSLILARRQFSDIGGNTPISREMTRAIDRDNQSLLSYSSAIVFDNRLRMTCAPNVSSQGVFHLGELVLNYDLLSSLRGKAQPVWDGLWTGTNTLQFVQGLFGPVSRAFAFTFNITDSQIQLYELLKTGTEHFDNEDVRIRWFIETPVIFNASVKNLTDLARLIDGEMYLTDVDEQVDVVVYYRPVFYPCWIHWHDFSVCADMSAENAKQHVRYGLGLGEPDGKVCDTINNRPFRDAEGFQLRIEFTGHAKLWGIKAMADPLPIPEFSKPAGCNNPNRFEAPVCLPLNCDVEDDYRIYSLDGLIPLPLPPVVPNPPLTFGNESVSECCDCPPEE